MRLDELFDLRRTRLPLEAGDDAIALDEDERRDLANLEPLCESGVALDVDPGHAQSVPLPAGDVCQRAFHPSCRPTVSGGEEDEQRL